MDNISHYLLLTIRYPLPTIFHKKAVFSYNGTRLFLFLGKVQV